LGKKRGRPSHPVIGRGEGGKKRLMKKKKRELSSKKKPPPAWVSGGKKGHLILRVGGKWIKGGGASRKSGGEPLTSKKIPEKGGEEGTIPLKKKADKNPEFLRGISGGGPGADRGREKGGYHSTWRGKGGFRGGKTSQQRDPTRFPGKVVETRRFGVDPEGDAREKMRP